jgi:hypothetical protein
VAPRVATNAGLKPYLAVVERLGHSWEAPETAVLVGLSIGHARRIGNNLDGIRILRKIHPGSSYTFDHRSDRLSLLVIHGVVAAAARC